MKEQRYLEACAKSGQVPFSNVEDSVLEQNNGLIEPLTATLIVEYGQELLNHYKWWLSQQDLYDIYEQVFIASLQCVANQNDAEQPLDHDVHITRAQTLLSKLQLAFPQSQVRVGRLRGMLLEAQGKPKEAIALYQAIIDEDETNVECRKRIICSLISQRLINDAINALNELLQVFMNDVESWEMLSDLYCQLKRFEEAAFCIEEILLLRPTNWTYHVKYAEIHVSVGSPESFSVARKYYCHALELCPNSFVALEGVQLCSGKIETLRQTDPQASKRLQHISPSNTVEKEIAILVNAKIGRR